MTHDYCNDCGEHIEDCKCIREEDMDNKIPVDQFIERNGMGTREDWLPGPDDSNEWDRLTYDFGGQRAANKKTYAKRMKQGSDSNFEDELLLKRPFLKCRRCETISEQYEPWFICPFCGHFTTGLEPNAK